MKLTAVFEAIMATKIHVGSSLRKISISIMQPSCSCMFARSNVHMLQPDGQVAVANWYFMIILVTFLV